MSEWIPHNLGELIEVQNGYAFKSKDFDDFNGIPVIKIKNVASGELRMDDIKYYPLTIAGLERFVISKNDILIALTGSHVNQPSSIVGKVARYTNDEISLLNQRVGKIYSLDEKETNEDYIYWFFKQWEVTLELALNAGGSANQANISGKLIKTLELELPPLPEQRAIASVLSSLDDKIDLLHRQNKTLEAMAETLYRQWFVEEAQEDWEDGKIPDEFDYVMGSSPPGESYNETGEGVPMFQGNADFEFRFPKRRIFTTDPKRFAEKHDTLISVRAPVGAQNMANEKCCIGRGVAAFRYKQNNDYYTYTYFKMKSLMEEIKQFNDTGTVFGSISKGDFETFDILLPPDDLVDRFQIEVKPIDDKVISNTTQIRTLEKLRDTLLPKLMSGEVRVEYEN